MLSINVENIGDEAQGLSASDQYLYDVEERQFSSDATYALAVDSPIFEEISPSNSVEVEIPFDVPEDAEIEFAELQDSPLSGGVLVDLR